jgi:excinuclease ABC subunit C
MATMDASIDPTPGDADPSRAFTPVDPDTPRDQRLAALLQHAHALPGTPGVYLMKDHKGVVLYVGKALSLRDRVASYFVPSADLGPKKQRMLDQIVAFETIDCETEWEALLAENRLIKDIHPPFNSRLVDDKKNPYLAVTLRDDFPGVYVTRDPHAPQFRGAKLFGPFTSVVLLRDALQHLQRAFRFRTCELDIRADDEKRRFFRPCLLYSIRQCTAPCADKIGKEPYRADIDRFVRFLGSKRSAMLREMNREMTEAAEKLEFEKAATLRDQIRAIERLDDRGSIRDQWQPETESLIADPKKALASLARVLDADQPIRCMECIDIAHLQGGETVGSKVCFIDGRPFKNEYRRYKIRSATNDDYESIREVVTRRYREAGQGQELYPDLILIDGGLGQLHAAHEALDGLEVQPPLVASIAKKEELLYTRDKGEPIRLGRTNPALKLCQAIRDEAHRFAQHYHHVLRRKRVVGD